MIIGYQSLRLINKNKYIQNFVSFYLKEMCQSRMNGFVVNVYLHRILYFILWLFHHTFYFIQERQLCQSLEVWKLRVIYLFRCSIVIWALYLLHYTTEPYVTFVVCVMVAKQKKDASWNMVVITVKYCN